MVTASESENHGLGQLHGCLPTHSNFWPCTRHPKCHTMCLSIVQTILELRLAGAGPTSLVSLLQCLTTFWVKNLFLLFSLNLPWLCFMPFFTPVPHHQREEMWTWLSCSPQEEVVDCGEVSLHYSPNWTDQVTSTAPHKSSPPDPSPSFCPSFGSSLIASCLSYIVVLKTAHSDCDWPSAEQSGITTSLVQQVMLCLVHPSL